MNQYYIIFIILIYLYSYKICNSQDNIMDKLEFIRQVMLIEDINFNQYTKIKVFNEKLYFMNRSKKNITQKDTIKIYEYDDDYILKYSFQYPENDVLIDFVLNDNFIYLLNQNSLIKLQILNNKVELIMKYKLVDYYNELKFENEKLILTNSCFSCSQPGIRSLIIDSSFSNLQNFEFEPPFAFQMSFYHPNRRFIYKNFKYIISSIIDYEIKIYDISTQEYLLLKREYSIFNNPDNVRNNFDTNNYDFWLTNRKYNDSLPRKTGRIELVDMIDDTTLFVCYSVANKEYKELDKYKYDIWNFDKNINNWNLKFKDLTFIQGDFKKVPNSLGEVGGGIGVNYIIDSGYIITPKFVPLDMIKSNFYKRSLEDIYKDISEYHKLNSKKFSSLFVYKLIK